MSWFVTCLVVSNLTIGIGLFLLGWWSGARMRRAPTTEDIRDYMAAAVHREEAEELRRRTRLNMARSGTRTTRSDGGPPAVVQRMRKRRNKIHKPIDQ